MAKSKIKILYIDDDPNNLNAFKSAFRKDYQIYLAPSAEEGHQILLTHEIQIIIADQRMPGMTGIEFFAMILKEFPNPIRILLTGYTDPDALINAINKGQVYRYIYKPWNEQELRVAIENAYEIYHIRQQLERKNAELRKKNDELSNLKDRLFSVIAHDLRGPISSLRSILEMISHGHISDQEFKDLSAQLYKRVDLTYKLLDNLLNWSKLQMKSFTVAFKKTSLDRIVQECVDLIKEDAQKKNITIETLFDEDYLLSTEPEMLKAVIRNLLTNAVKFTPEHRKISIIIKGENDTLKIQVKDEGTGISEENMKKLFRIDQAFTTPGTNKEKGSGMGLIISNDFVKKMGGELLVESIPDQGSTFTVILPEVGLTVAPV